MTTKLFNPGELTCQIVIEKLPATKARNADGGEKRSVDQWETHCEAWAKIDTQGGREFYRARSVDNTLTHELTIYWQLGITPKMRVRFEDPIELVTRYFSIEAIPSKDPARSWMLLLHCKELVGREART